jgi:putative FmdB family regulatory protein
MGYKLFDYSCNNCGLLFEELVKDKNETVDCPECKSSDTSVALSTPKLATMNLLSPQEHKAKMLKRSEEHTKKEVMREPEKYGVRKLRNK